MFSIYKIFGFNKVLDATLMVMFYDFLMLKICVISFICPVKVVLQPICPFYCVHITFGFLPLLF